MDKSAKTNVPAGPSSHSDMRPPHFSPPPPGGCRIFGIFGVIAIVIDIIIVIVIIVVNIIIMIVNITTGKLGPKTLNMPPT